MKKMYRQGDILIVEDNTQEPQNPIESGIVAYGEVTGHSHKLHSLHPGLLATQILEQDRPHVKSFKHNNISLLDHDEHNTIILPPATHTVIRQREYTETVPRQVAD